MAFDSVVASFFFIDSLDQVYVVTETLVILKMFLSHGPDTTCRFVERSAARNVPTRLSFGAKK